METPEVNQVDVSIAARASQIRSHIQRDILVDDVRGERTFVMHYLRRWEIFGGHTESTEKGRYPTGVIPWMDWTDVW